MKPLQLPLAYFGPLCHYAVQLTCSEQTFDIHEHYVKQSWRNRCVIHGANGAMNLIIPVQHTVQHIAIKDVRIDHSQEWQTVHWKSLESAYRSSPFFEYYEDSLHEFYSKKYQLLTDFLIEGEEWIWACLGQPRKLNLSIKYESVPDGMDLRQLLQPKTFKAPPGLFPVYYQVFSDNNGFIPNLSILDMLFSKGPGSLKYIQDIAPTVCQYLGEQLKNNKEGIQV